MNESSAIDVQCCMVKLGVFSIIAFKDTFSNVGTSYYIYNINLTIFNTDGRRGVRGVFSRARVLVQAVRKLIRQVFIDTTTIILRVFLYTSILSRIYIYINNSFTANHAGQVRDASRITDEETNSC